MTQPLVFQGVRIFDGVTVHSRATVIVTGDTIRAVGEDIPIPPESDVIDGAGKTLLPGLIDAHTHVYGPALQQALVFGVTTELDMFTDHRFAAHMRREEAEGAGADRADLRSAGTLVTAPGGHGTEYGIPIPTITAPGEADAFVDARIAEGSDYIKIIYDDGSPIGMHYPSITKETMVAVVAAAHRRGKLVVVHILSLAQARDAIDAGADGLAHLFVDRLPDPEFGRFLAAHRVFVIPTLTVLEALTGVPSGATLADDSRLAPYLSATDMLGLRSAFAVPPMVSPTLTAAEEAVRQCQVAGVPILAGTDAPNPGTMHGASIHRELELLVRAGLTPVAALATATAVPATVFGLPDRGRVAPGLRADLLLVDGDPTTNIAATRAIVGIWKCGVPVDRESYRGEIARRQAVAAAQPLPKGAESGWVSDFADGTLATRFGAGWAVSTDQVRGGTSTAAFSVVPDGVHGRDGSLRVTGVVAPGRGSGWAGAMFVPGVAFGEAANLARFREITFWTKGDGQTYRVMLLAHSLQIIPVSRSFVADPEWREVSLPFAAFNGMDGTELLGVVFAAGPALGAFTFDLDDVRFR